MLNMGFPCWGAGHEDMRILQDPASSVFLRSVFSFVGLLFLKAPTCLSIPRVYGAVAETAVVVEVNDAALKS